MILVTGGAGYIGSHVCKSLKKAGFTPVVYDNFSTGHLAAVKWGPFVKGDIRDSETLRQAIRTYQPKAVLHFAADALVIESMQNPSKYYRNNVTGTLTLLETMCEEGVKNLVFSSTCAIYGCPKNVPIDEKTPAFPINPYGRTKWMAEQMMADFDQAYGLKTIKLRYFNAAGADAQTEIGEKHDPETHLVPIVIQSALGTRPETVIYGNTFPTKDGSAIRDYIHVEDLAQAHLLALQYVLQEQKSDVFNLGSSIGTSVLEIIQAVQSHSQKPVPIRIAPARPGEPAILMANPTKANKLLGWEPKHTLPSIIDTAWKWHNQ